MPDVDSKLATSLRQAKQQPMYFAFVAKGASEGVLLVSKKKIPAKDINEAKQESGGKKVFRGRCMGEDGSMVFEMAKEAPGALAKQLKAVIKEQAGMMMQVETRVAPDLEEEGDEVDTEQGEADSIPKAPPPPPPPPTARDTVPQAPPPANQAPPAPPPPPADLAARFGAKLKALAPVLQKVEGIQSLQAKEAKQAVTEANSLFRAKNYNDALETLEIAEGLMKEALLANAKAPPAPPPAPTKDPAVARFSARLKALAPVMQKALATGNDQAKQAQQQIGEANKLFTAKQFEPANAALDQAEALMKQALLAGLQKPAPTAPPPQESEQQEAEQQDADADSELIAEFQATLKALQPKLQRALDLAGKSNASEAAELDAMFNEAMGEHQADNHAQAYDLLTSLDARVTAFLRNAKAQAEVRQAAGPENVAFVASKMEWEKARASARSELSRFQNAVLGDAATKEDPRYADSIVPTVKGLDKVLQNFDDRINAALDEAVNLPAQQKAPPIQKALDIIGEYRQALAGNQMIKLIDSGAYGGSNIGGVLSTALDTMSKRLTKRLKAL